MTMSIGDDIILAASKSGVLTYTMGKLLSDIYDGNWCVSFVYSTCVAMNVFK